MQKVGIIGLGYVGLPLACLCVKKGYAVIGVDVDERKITLINAKTAPFKDERLAEELKKYPVHATNESSKLKECQTIIICVPTPVEKYKPDISYVVHATETVSQNLKKGALVVVESTIHPTTCEEIVLPIFKKQNLVHERDFLLAHCPERIDPGNKTWNVENIPRVVGGLTPKATEAAYTFYQSLINAQIMQLSSIRAAEAVKITENTFRDVNIAFVNELAMSFDRMGINTVEVIRGAATKPFSFLAHYPSCGVGGHCIPVDPYYLIEQAKSKGFDHNFLLLARSINHHMPEYAVSRLADALNEIGKSIKGTKIGLLGLAYKGNVDDIRESPAFEIIDLLKKKGAELIIYDPYVKEKSTVDNLENVISSAEVLFVVTDHEEFVSMDLSKLRNTSIKLIVDGRNCLNRKAVKRLGLMYKGIGR